MRKEVKGLLLANRWFLLPVLLWGLAGGILMLFYPLHDLFLFVNQRHSPLLDRLMTCFSAYGRGDVIPFILVPILMVPAYRNRRYLLTASIYGILIPIIIYLSKEFFKEPRPLIVFGKERVHTVPWLQDLHNNSFPSGHTFAVFGLFTILSFLLPKSLKPWSIFFFILAMVCGYSRMYLGQHFFQDVYCGSLVGVFCSAIIFIRIHSVKSDKV